MGQEEKLSTVYQALEATERRMEELRRQQTNTILRQERDAAITRETELVRLNGDLRSQNRKYREHVGVLLEELKDAWWRRAANAYAHLEAIHRDEIQ